MKINRSMLAGAGLLALGCASALAQQVTGVPGSPGATTTIDGKQLPPPDPKFGGVIKEKASESKAWWAPRVVPPKGAPNVLLIMTDDVGFGAPGTFGGVVPTPALDRIANSGTALHEFSLHVALLADARGVDHRPQPSRGRLRRGGRSRDRVPGLRLGHQEGERHHRHDPEGERVRDLVVRQEPQHALLSGDPGRAVRPVAERDGLRIFLRLRRRRRQPVAAEPVPQYDGHLSLPGQAGLEPDHGHGRRGDPVHEAAQGRSRPTSRSSSTTCRAARTRRIIRRRSGSRRSATCTSSTRAGTSCARPSSPTRSGWASCPPNAKLTAWPKELPEWDSLSLEEKKLFIKQADVYGAYLAYTDHEIGRVIQAVEDLGELDNTLIIYISGDNGASAEGMLNGTPNEFTTFNGVPVPVKDQFLWYEFWGSERTFPHFAAGWAWAMDTPFKWTKQVASHFGGTAQGMAMSWPGHINDVGGIRRQFHHVIDIVPTILEATGIPAPDTINGIKQRPIEGVSMAYTWDKANANAPTRHTTQYFEMLGNRAIYHDGWVAATTPATLPWELSTATPPDVITGYKWELYNVKEDPTQSNDLAAKMPDKLKQMQDLFYAEAKKYDVLPLDNSTLARLNTPRPSLTAGRTVFTYSGELTGVPNSGAPSILNKSYTITAEVAIPEGGAEGMIVTDGGRFGGYGLFLSKGESASAGASRCFSTTCSTSSARRGKGRSWAPASTPSSSTSSPTVRAWARAARACSPWTARKWPGIPWSTPRRSRSRRTKPSTSARTPAPAWR